MFHPVQMLIFFKNNGCFPPLQTANSTTMSPIHNICSYCSDVVPAVSSSVLETTGGIGLFFSFTEVKLVVFF